MIKNVKVALCQTKVFADKKKNIEKNRLALIEAKKQKADIAVLPEMFNCPYDINFFREYSEKIPQGYTSKFLSQTAKDLNIYIVGGSIPEFYRGSIYNTSSVYDNKGKLIAKHRKIHLFDINLKNVKVQESKVFSCGHNITVFKTPFGKFGLAICYDMRFPEIFRLMKDKDVSAVFIPAAFSVDTGNAHWKELLKIRAVDNQIFIIAVSPARIQKRGYMAFGHSSAYDPWGNCLYEMNSKENVATVVLDHKKINQVRQRMPLLKHIRKDLYGVIKKK